MRDNIPRGAIRSHAPPDRAGIPSVTPPRTGGNHDKTATSLRSNCQSLLPWPTPHHFVLEAQGLCGVFGWRIFCEQQLPLGMRRVHSSAMRSRPLARSRVLSPSQFITAGGKQHVGRGAAGRWHGRVAIWECHNPVTSLGRGCQKLRFKVGDRSL